MRALIVITILFFHNVAIAQVVINEVQALPIGERFIELYNSSNSDIDLTGWYIQRKTATGNSFGSLVTSSQFKDKSIKANEYFLISKNLSINPDITIDNLTLTESSTLRIRNSNGEDIDQIELKVVLDGKSYQKISASEWVSAVPTPGMVNAVTTSASQAISIPAINTVLNSTLSVTDFPVDPQIFADAGVAMRTVPAGAPVIFTGRAFGLKKEPIENARMVWSFGDGGTVEGTSVTHTYHYPGDYIAVLDVASGHYSASDRTSVHVVTPLLVLRSGGDAMRSYIAIENQGSDEIDLSLWQIESNEKFFVIPKNTIVGEKKTLTFASEITGLSSNREGSVTLRFPNGSVFKTEESYIKQASVTPVTVKQKIEKPLADQVQIFINDTKESKQYKPTQEASVSNAFSNSLPIDKNADKMWKWYTGVAILAILALIGIRLAGNRSPKNNNDLQADDFEIVEDDDTDKKSDIF